ncbi:hypothetical protein PENSPDRAFT_695553, partial [Peniophora sp. CONT]
TGASQTGAPQAGSSHAGGSQFNPQTGASQTGAPQAGSSQAGGSHFNSQAGSSQAGGSQFNPQGSATGSPQTNTSGGAFQQGVPPGPSVSAAPAVDPVASAFMRGLLQEFGTSLLAGFAEKAERYTTVFEHSMRSMTETLTEFRQEMRDQSGQRPAGQSSTKKKPVPDDETQPFNPANDGTGPPGELDGDELEAKSIIRAHLQAIFDAQGAGQYGPDVSLQLITDVNAWVAQQTGGKKRLQRSFRFVIPRGMKAKNIGIDYDIAGPKSSGYNRLMAQIFTEDLMASGKAEDLTEDDIMDLYFRRVKSLKKQRTDEINLETYANNLGVNKTDLEVTRAHEAAIEQRRRSLFHRRCTVGDRLKEENVDPKGEIVRFLRMLGVEGTSGDESDWVASKKNPGSRRRKRIVVDFAWRDRKCRILMSAMDDLYEWTESKIAMGSVERRGSLPERRYFYEDNDRDEDALAVVNLPWNIYDEAWSKSKGKTYMRTVIQPRKAAFEIPEGFWDHYHAMSKLWQEHTAGKNGKGKGRA